MGTATQETMYLTQPKPTYLTESPAMTPLKPAPTAAEATASINEVWSKNNFRNVKQKLELKLNAQKMMSWTEEKVDSEECSEGKSESPATSPAVMEAKMKEDSSHHARRPMNAFLIFCKKHRSVVKEKYPNSENRAVTRILGEWWAQLNSVDKAPYTNLAKEYKDAFFSANPDFKWYKLPAPPLRTLTTRPANAPKATSPVLTSPINTTSPRPEFTPGKLADESQLGSLTSLMNISTNFNNNNNNNNNNFADVSKNRNDDGESNKNKERVNTENNNRQNVADNNKPIKKRFYDNYLETTQIFNFDISPNQADDSYERNMTKQDLLNKVVDSMFIPDAEDAQRSRKSERSCKGKRYEQFMVENKLLSGGKRHYLDKKFDCMETFSKSETSTPKLDLENTIKRLAERTNFKLEEPASCEEKVVDVQANFNLDERISNLPSLSYENYLQRKRESKKRKIRSKSECEAVNKVEKKFSVGLVGSKKRKNKRSITHLEKVDEGVGCDLSGLATLAEIAAITEKINEK